MAPAALADAIRLVEKQVFWRAKLIEV